MLFAECHCNDPYSWYRVAALIAASLFILVGIAIAGALHEDT